MTGTTSTQRPAGRQGNGLEGHDREGSARTAAVGLPAPALAPAAPYVSVVLPVYNEAGHLADEVARIRHSLETSGHTYEVIVVDDGSTDGSGDIADAIAESVPEVRVIRARRNRGAGTARHLGTRAARGEVVVWTDVDMTYPNHEIPRLVEALAGSDQVVGARTSEQGTARRIRASAKWVIRRLAAYLANQAIPDLNSGFRAFRREVALQYLHLLPPGFSCVTTMTMTFLANGYSVSYLPIDYQPRAGTSKFHWWRDTKLYLIQVIRLIMSYDPLRIFVPLGTALAVIGMGKLGFDLVLHPFRVATNTLLILFAALQVLVIGLLADLVVRLNRPRRDVDPV